MSIRSELREAVIARSHGRCDWPRCGNAGSELAHLHSIGAGGRESADTIDNVGWLCFDHARMSDGEYGRGGAIQYRQSHLDLFGDAFLDMPANIIAWERAEALRRVVAR